MADGPRQLPDRGAAANEEPLTASEVAPMLGLSRRAVYQLASTGLLPCYRVGAGRGAVRFNPNDVQEYLDSCRSAGTSATSAGGMSSTATFKAAATGLLSYFQRAGVRPKLTPSTAPKAPGSTPLRLVSSKSTR